MPSDALRKALTSVGEGTYRPLAFLMWAVFALLWFIFDRQSFDWHGIATLWLMTINAPSTAIPKPSTRSSMKSCGHLGVPTIGLPTSMSCNPKKLRSGETKREVRARGAWPLAVGELSRLTS